MNKAPFDYYPNRHTLNGKIVDLERTSEDEDRWTWHAWHAGNIVATEYSERQCLASARAWANRQPSEEMNTLSQMQVWEATFDAFMTEVQANH